jgi:hypothetical protein
MRSMLAVVVAGGLCLGMASRADAQVALSVGNPYVGGFSLGVPFGGFYGVPYGVAGAVPGATYYSSGYYGVYPGVSTYSYGVAPVAPVGVYGYRAFYPRPFGYYGGFGRFGFPGFRRRIWGYW